MRHALEKFLEWVVVALMASMALVVVAGVLFRKFGAPLVWYDEVAPILLAWLTYYGSCLAALKRAHIGFPRFVSAASWRLKLSLTIVREVVVIGFFALAAWAGWKVLEVLEGTSLISLPWAPAQFTQSVIPLSALLFIVVELTAFAEWYSAEREAPR